MCMAMHPDPKPNPSPNPYPNPSPSPNPHQVLGDLELIDQGELDHKIIAIDAADPMAAKINSIADLKVRG